MGSLFYQLIIYPLTQVIEFAFAFCYKLSGSTGISLIGVSLTVSMLTLPLYIVAEHWQQIEREIEKKLKPETAKIKAVFHGDEQYMILSAYYRENHYHPIMALRSSFGLLIQIPFFTAAYMCLSHMSALQGKSFLFIPDMGKPDALFMIGSFTVNVLPIAMTLINGISGALYTRGLSLRDKLQVYLLALIFVVLLYNSPAGLVLYWTMNNIFSLIKNIFYKLKNPLKVLYVLMSGCALLLTVFIFAGHVISPKNGIIIACGLSVVYFIPLIVRLVNYLIDTAGRTLRDDPAKRFVLFVISAAGLCLLTGFFIPSQLIASSPVEFSGIDGYANPLFFVKNTFMQSAGLFFIWPMLIYLLYHERVQTLFAVISAILFSGALVNTFLFQGSYGILSRLLIFTQVPELSSGKTITLINIFVLFITAIAVIIPVCLKKTAILSSVAGIAVASLTGISVVNSTAINRGYTEYTRQLADHAQKKTVDPVFHFSKTGKNVLFIYLDRAENRFVQTIFDESPELYTDFSGFTLYADTVSFNGHTLLGAPPCYGGYEYTPEAMNKRTNETLISKQNESLLLLPRIFTEQSDYSAVCTDPTWANYNWIPDLSIFKPYPEITGVTTDAVYLDQWYKEHQDTANFGVTAKTLKRNILWYGFLRESPLILQRAIYNQGAYWSADRSTDDYNDFLNGYSVLDYLPRLTAFDGTGNTYTSFTNNTTHDNLSDLQAPEYRPVSAVTNPGSTRYSAEGSYGTNAASLHRLGEWFSLMQQQGIYDNTRIIIMADHGCTDREEAYAWDSTFEKIKPGHYHPLLLFKDFGAQGTLSVNSDFMTNADVPTLLIHGTGSGSPDLIPDAKNPFTGNLINAQAKDAGALICTSNIFMPYQNADKYVFTPRKDEWWRVKGDIFNSANWTQEVQK